MRTQTEKKWFTTLGMLVCLAMMAFLAAALFPTAAGATTATAVLNPDANVYGEVQWNRYDTSKAHWEIVSDDSNSTLVWVAEQYPPNPKKEMFYFSNFTFPAGSTINWVRVCWKGCRNPWLIGIQPMFHYGSGDYTAGDSSDLTTSWESYVGTQITTCPWTGSGWTQQNIDDMGAGVKDSDDGNGNAVANVSKVWVEVNYTY